MNDKEQDILAQTLFRHLAENVPAWREVPITPDSPEELERAPGYSRWRRANYRNGEAQSRYESNRRLIMDAGRHLEAMGYKTTSIRSATPGTVSVRVANAGSWRLCVRIPHEIAERIIILGFVPRI